MSQGVPGLEFGSDEVPEEHGVGAWGDASGAVAESDVAGLAHGGEVGVGVELGFGGAEAGAVFDAEEVPDGQLVGRGAEDAAATVAVEDAGLLGGSDAAAERLDGAGPPPGLGLGGVVEVNVADPAAHRGLIGHDDE